jgi:SAM-dependent methyltransferase
MSTWDERFREGTYPRDPDPSPVLERYVESFPDGRALDLATGTGRNAVFLAGEGYEVDALDRSREGLRIARENAVANGVENRTNWIRADATEYEYPESTYDLVTISFYRAVDRFPDVKAALTDGGILFVQHHLRSADAPDVGPSDDRYRFPSNDLLHACLDLTVLFYAEVTEDREDGRTAATAQLVARNSTGQRQSYPHVSL